MSQPQDARAKVVLGTGPRTVPGLRKGSAARAQAPGEAWPKSGSLGAWHRPRPENRPGRFQSPSSRAGWGGPGAGRGHSYLPRYFIRFAPTDPVYLSGNAAAAEAGGKLGPRERQGPGPPPEPQPRLPCSLTWVPGPSAWGQPPRHRPCREAGLRTPQGARSGPGLAWLSCVTVAKKG